MTNKQRDRGRILTPEVLAKLQHAIRDWEVKHEKRCTQERMKELTSAFKEGGLDPGTISKILKGKGGVDPESIRCLFSTFGLVLEEADLLSSIPFVLQVNPNFVGREGAIADLNTLINRGAKVIVIQARGGVGKTTLARKYLQQEFDYMLEFPIAKETKDIASIESLIEEKLRQLGEEPGREFLISIDRLKRKLQAERIGILIDNLEPALDAAGKFIELHRRYVELLRVLADPSMQSITLITSRERLHEPGITVQHYPLRSLDASAWEQFFQLRQLSITTPALPALHHAYGGNAKAMEIISSVIQTDYSGDLEVYWQENQDDLLIERDLEDLVINQFNRLLEVDPDAYKLLCRMGCYRYQDVPTVSTEGVLCLLWDVPEPRQRRVIRSLQERSLVEFENGEYWLHPVIRGEALERLRGNEDWETANRRAAEFWTENVVTIEIIDDTIRAFEAYYHCVEIKDFEKAGFVLLTRRQSKSVDYKKLELGRSLYRLGLIQQSIAVIEEIIRNIETKTSGDKSLKYHLSRLYNILAVPSRISGHIHTAIQYHEKAIELASEHFESLPNKQDSDFLELEVSKINALIGISMCKGALWDLESALEILENINLSILNQNLETTSAYGEMGEYAIDCFLAYLHSCLKNDSKTSIFVDNIYRTLTTEKQLGTGYRLLYLVMAYKNLGLLDKSFEICNQVIFYSEKFQYFGTQATSFNCLASIYRERKQFESAIENHSKAIAYLSQAGALSDLAESYYQFGLTYQAMGEEDKSSASFQEATRLFIRMEAPRQVERVRQSMKGRN